MGTTDQTFKRLLHDFAQAVIQLAFGSASDVEPLPSELAIERQLLPDSLFRALCAAPVSDIEALSQTTLPALLRVCCPRLSGVPFTSAFACDICVSTWGY